MSTEIMARRKPIGQILKELELLNEGQLQEGLDLQRRQGGLIGEILVTIGYVSGEEVLLALAEQNGAVIAEGPEGEIDPHPLFELGEGRTRATAPLFSPSLHRFLVKALETALGAGGTELRLERIDDRYELRYVVDGSFHELELPPSEQGAHVIALLKWQAGLDPSRSDVPQIIRSFLSLAGLERRVEASSAPLPRGESVVLRFWKP